MISKADRIDGGGSVEGLVTTNMYDNYCIKCLDCDVSEFIYPIDVQTLKHSFDNGRTWYSEFEIQSALNTWVDDNNTIIKKIIEGISNV